MDDILRIPAVVRAVEDMFLGNRWERELCESRAILASIIVVQDSGHIGIFVYRKFEGVVNEEETNNLSFYMTLHAKMLT
jgi:hypothetical protein